MNEKYLYFEPTIYIPYEVNLRNKKSIKLTSMWVENGQEVNIDGSFKKFVRLPNKNYFIVQFKQPLYMDVSEIVGTEGVITLHMQYEINFNGEEAINIFHKQNLNFQSHLKKHNVINHYSSSMALPAMFGMKGLSLAKEIVNQGTDQYILQIGLLGESKLNKTWCLETLNMLYPSVELQHGIIH